MEIKSEIRLYISNLGCLFYLFISCVVSGIDICGTEGQGDLGDCKNCTALESQSFQFWSLESSSDIPWLSNIDLVNSSTYGTSLAYSWRLVTQGDKKSFPNGTSLLSKNTVSCMECILRQNVEIISSCFPVEAGEVVNTSLKLQGTNTWFLYTTKVPETILFEPNDASEWLPVVSIAALPSSTQIARILVVFSAPPIGIYVVNVTVRLHGNQDLQEKVLPVNENVSSVVFNVASTEVTYKASVQADGCNNSTCAQVFSPDVFLPAKPMTSASTQSPAFTSVVTSAAAETQPAITTTSTVPSVIVKPSTDQNDTYNRDLKIILGTVFGVLGVVVIIIVVWCICKKKRNGGSGSFPLIRFGGADSDTSSVDNTSKQPPSVLIIYSYDCEPHERSVVEFATYLKHEVGLEVTMDIWEQMEVNTRGAARWLDEKLDWCQNVIVICSTGARFKCVRNKHFHMKQTRPIAETFCMSVDQVVERLRTGKANNDHVPRVLVCYFEYSGASDIPPKLDTFPKFILMKDMYQLYSVLFNVKSNAVNTKRAVTESTYKKCATGKQLYNVIEKTKQYFEENPDWLGLILEPNSPNIKPLVKPDHKEDQDSDKTDADSTENNKHEEGDIKCPIVHVNGKEETVIGSPKTERQTHSRVSSMGTSSIVSEDEALLEERRKRRKKEEEKKMERVPSGTKISDMVVEQSPAPSPGKTEKLKPSPAKSERLIKSPPKSLNLNNIHHSLSSSKLKGHKFGRKNSGDQYFQRPKYNNLEEKLVKEYDDEYVDLDEENIEKDIEFINNYDNIKYGQVNNGIDPTLIDMNFVDSLSQTSINLTPIGKGYFNFSLSNSEDLCSNGSVKSRRGKSVNNNDDFVINFEGQQSRTPVNDNSTYL